MSRVMEIELIELTDAELDLVAGGAPQQNQNAVTQAGGAAVGGLLAAGAGVAATVQANVNDVASHNNVAVSPVVVV